MKKSKNNQRKEALSVQIRTESASFSFLRTYSSKKRKFFSGLVLSTAIIKSIELFTSAKKGRE
jgi:hypothetical protein